MTSMRGRSATYSMSNVSYSMLFYNPFIYVSFNWHYTNLVMLLRLNHVARRRLRHLPLSLRLSAGTLAAKAAEGKVWQRLQPESRRNGVPNGLGRKIAGGW